MTRSRLAVAAATLCALIVSLAIAVAPASAEGGAANLPEYEGLGSFPTVQAAGDQDEFSWLVTLGKGQSLRLVSETEAWVEYEDGHESFPIKAGPAKDRIGAIVPTTLRVSEGDVVTLVIHDREGNPAAGGAPFAYPIVPADQWFDPNIEPIIVKGPPDEKEIAEEKAAAQRAKEAKIAQEIAEREAAAPPAPAPATEPPAPTCTVPSLRGLALRTAKAKLRADHCGVGKIHLARGASTGKGKVARQFTPPGAWLAAGTPVAVKLAAR
jgi:hypothetical protein